MKQRVRTRHPVRVVPGSELAQSVLRPDGVVLLAAGAVLDEDMLAHLHQRGVEVLSVKENDPRDEAAVAAERTAAEERVRRIFSGRAGGEMRDDLTRAVLEYRRNQAA